MFQIQCECGKFKAELAHFPKNTPGRLKCYCNDCQAFMNHLGRGDLLDENGGTEIIPAYPVDIKITAGKELLKCTRLYTKGMFRFSTTCCNTPVANTDPVRPWVGFHRRLYTSGDSQRLDQTFHSVKSSIMGKHAKGTPPPGTPEKFNFKAFYSVVPFLLKGLLFRKAKSSPFFNNGECIVTPVVLSREERERIKTSAS